MRKAKIAGAALWFLNVLLGGATIVVAFQFLVFRAYANPIGDVEADAVVTARPTSRPQENFASLRNFQNPVEPRVIEDNRPLASEIKGVDLSGTVTSPDNAAEIMAYLAIPARQAYPNAYFDQPVLLSGDPVAEMAGWKLRSVTRDSATFWNGTKETTLRTKESAIGGTAGIGPAGGAGVIPAGGVVPPGFDRSQLKISKIASSNDSETYTINQPSIAWATANQDMLLNEVGLQDYSSGGIQIVSMASGSMAEQFGLRPNDVIRSVNGQPITNSLALAELRNSPVIQRATALTVGVERAGQVRALVIRPTK